MAEKFQSCHNIKKWLHEKTNKEVEVTNTGTFLKVNWVADGRLMSEKIRIPAKVLYCLEESDFKGLLQKLQS